MPLSFRLGLALTIASLAVVACLYSIRMLRRLASSPQAAAGRESHFAIIWGAIIICLPVVAILLYPQLGTDLSGKLDKMFSSISYEPDIRHAPVRPEWNILSGSELEKLRAKSDELKQDAKEVIRDANSKSKLRKKNALKLGAIILGVAVLCTLLAELSLRRRLSWAFLIFILTSLGFFAALMVKGGDIASNLSGALDSRDAIERYAKGGAIPAAAADGISGVVRIVGVSNFGDNLKPEDQYIFYQGPLATVRSPLENTEFKMDNIVITSSTLNNRFIVRPHVRARLEGKEHFILNGPQIVVMGMLLDSKIQASLHFPVIIAPAGTSNVMDVCAKNLLGSRQIRTRQLGVLQAISGFGLAWCISLLIATMSEFALKTRLEFKARNELKAHIKAETSPQ